MHQIQVKLVLYSTLHVDFNEFVDFISSRIPFKTVKLSIYIP